MSPTPVYLGVDIAKDSLDVHFLGQSHSLANTTAGISRLIKMLSKHPDPGCLHIICEATGGYERALCTALHHNKTTLSVVNP
ncbi:transposase, partial [Prosthecobacter fusiformis]